MDLIQKANKLGYKHYTEFTVEELDNLSLENSNKQIEYYFIQKWLREKHNIDIQITRNKPGYNEYRVEIYQTFENSNIYKHFQINEDNSKFCKWFDIYEEALEVGLKEALKLI